MQIEQIDFELPDDVLAGLAARDLVSPHGGMRKFTDALKTYVNNPTEAESPGTMLAKAAPVVAMAKPIATKAVPIAKKGAAVVGKMVPKFTKTPLGVGVAVGGVAVSAAGGAYLAWRRKAAQRFLRLNEALCEYVAAIRDQKMQEFVISELLMALNQVYQSKQQRKLLKVLDTKLYRSVTRSVAQYTKDLFAAQGKDAPQISHDAEQTVMDIRPYLRLQSQLFD